MRGEIPGSSSAADADAISLVSAREARPFGPAGRRLGWMRLYALARLGARLPGQPLVLADADVAWLRSDAPRLLLDTCAAGFDAAFVRDAPGWSHVGLASGGLVLSCGASAATAPNAAAARRRRCDSARAT